jgi:serine/threonine protein kinase
MEAVDTFGLVGTTIADKYVVESVADAGGTAIVYRAFHQLWKRPVALKVFRTPAEIGDDARAALLDRFVMEGRLLAELSERSSAVLQARDIGTTTTPSGEWVPYMVLEWLDGATLEHVLEDEGVLGMPTRTLAQAMTLLDPIVQALELAHRRGIVHRDVKPANIFVVGDARGPEVVLKLLDFGIAKVVEDARGAGAFGKTGMCTAFTPAYGAPEQFCRGARRACDVADGHGKGERAREWDRECGGGSGAGAGRGAGLPGRDGDGPGERLLHGLGRARRGERRAAGAQGSARCILH